ncbi:MAG: uroporphyrinogen-III synthase, partial [Candidatus Omnitrophica bacterium]|nr:uroporphyrinogen-III synthase [Candidatus Omnitrophota bacterium]
KNKLQQFGIVADLVPKIESSAGLIKAFERLDIKGKKIFLPRSDISNKGLTEKIRQMQAKVEEAVAYKNVAVRELPPINWDNFDQIFFTSPSGVRSFKRRYRKVPKGIKINCIGKVTEKEAKNWHFLK